MQDYNQALEAVASLPLALSQKREKTASLSLRKIGAKALPYAMVAPALAILSVFVLYPILYMIYLSFFKWNMIGPKEWVGLGNFTALLSDPAFHKTFANSFQYMFFTVLFSIGLALPLAVCLKRNSFLNRLLQGLSFAPYIVSLVSVAFIWMWLMDTDYGLLNFVLGIFGVSPVGWLDHPKVAMFSLVLVSVWKGIGYNTLILISAMQSVPGYLYEAANLDKAGSLSVFRRITFPLISPSLFFLTLMNMISAFKVFETVNIMTEGGPMNSTNTLVYSIYQYGFQFYKIGYASAMGVVLMAIIGLCTLLYFRALSGRVHYR